MGGCLPGGWFFSWCIGRDVGPGRVVSGQFEDSTSAALFISLSSRPSCSVNRGLSPRRSSTRAHPSLRETKPSVGTRCAVVCVECFRFSPGGCVDWA